MVFQNPKVNPNETAILSQDDAPQGYTRAKHGSLRLAGAYRLAELTKCISQTNNGPLGSAHTGVHPPMANTAFNIGDVVQLKSGGPKMTINSVRDSSGDYLCVWFRGASKEQGYFKDEVLQKVS